jgi:membrane protein DedA with SNARE-associated domain/rhodanese-related sulfurtransferase
LIQAVSQHGYLVASVVLFLAALGVPLPMSVTLLLAGAAAHHDLRMGVLLPLVWVVAVAGDVLLYFGGRYTGWWLLAGMCRLSLDPEQCIFRAAEYFYRRGAKTLLFAKFIPGLGAMAAPLAGSLNMRFGRFLRVDAAGVLLYCGVWLGLGYWFSGFLGAMVAVLESAGHVVLVGALLLVAAYLVAVGVFALRARKYRAIEKISAKGLRERLEAMGSDRLMVIADVRSHGYYDPGMQRIKNSIRVEPHRLKEELEALREFMAPECEIYLYCSCIRDTTSVRVAHMLQAENCHTQVIEGGMKAWLKAGGELEQVPESDLRRLPRFE